MSPVDEFTVHVPSPLITKVDSVHVGGVSFGPQRFRELGDKSVPLSLASGVNVTLPPAVPEPTSALADGAAGATIVAPIFEEKAVPTMSVAV
jgi:hypothetical protein